MTRCPRFSFAPRVRGGIVALCLHADKMTEESAPLYVVPTPLGNLVRPDAPRRRNPAQRALGGRRRHPPQRPLAQATGRSGAYHAGPPAQRTRSRRAHRREIASRRSGGADFRCRYAGYFRPRRPHCRCRARRRLQGRSACLARVRRRRRCPAPACSTSISCSTASCRARAASAARRWRNCAEHPYALVFYEAPHRVLETVADLAAVLGERTLVIARELTKLFESIHSGPLTAALEWLKEDPIASAANSS
jgi:16S rRNA (cytidine1402-2'-O)-methyltransferase